jgi:predicted aspartyl protease
LLQLDAFGGILHHPAVARTLRLRYPPGEARMGRILTTIVVRGFVDPSCEIRCDALVDTGAYCLTLPMSWKERLGPLPLSRPVQIVNADRHVVDGEVAGPVVIRIDGFPPHAGEVLFMPVVGDESEFEPLIGYITLEQAGIVVDMVGHRLVPMPYFDAKVVRAA